MPTDIVYIIYNITYIYIYKYNIYIIYKYKYIINIIIYNYMNICITYVAVCVG